MEGNTYNKNRDLPTSAQLGERAPTNSERVAAMHERLNQASKDYKINTPTLAEESDSSKEKKVNLDDFIE